MKSEFLLALNEICESRKLSSDVVIDAIETALVSAFRRNVGVSNAQNIAAKIDSETGTATIFAEKEVVEAVQDERTEVVILRARKFSDEPVALGDTVMVDSTPRDFGRIAAQTAKQVILQRIREAEREQLYEDFSGREGEIINGTVQNVTPQAVTIGLGRTEALLPRNQQVPGERYYHHDKVRAYVLEVRRASRGPQIIVSRSHRNMLRRMLELEVPEIYNGLVEIKSVAREAGQRSKVAVAALQDGVDPVGACVGMRGVRIQSVVRELNDEKIDIIEWNSDPRVFIAKALSPARVSQVYLHSDAPSGRTATVIVADDQLSLAIGRVGQNARLAAKLTGWRIDIKSLTEAAAEALAKRNDPLVVDAVSKNAAWLEHAEIILAKKAADRPITAEDFQTLNRVVDLIEGKFVERAETERRAEEQARKAVPVLYWEMPLSILELTEELGDSLNQHGFGTVGHVAAALVHDPDKFRERASLEADALVEVQERMTSADLPATAVELARWLAGDEELELEAVEEPEQPGAELAEETELVQLEDSAADDDAERVESSMEEPEPEPSSAALFEEPPLEVRIPAGEPEPLPVPKVEKEPERKGPKRAIVVPARREAGEEPAGVKKKGKRKRRRLVYDEAAGTVVTRRSRQRGGSSAWDEPSE